MVLLRKLVCCSQPRRSDAHIPHFFSLTYARFVLWLYLYCRYPRYFSGMLSAVLSGFLTYVYLEPLFVPVGLDLAVVALWILAINASLVGMSLGVLLPTLLPGLCCGASISLLVGSLLEVSSSLFFPVVGGGCAIVGAIFSTRYVLCFVHFFVHVHRKLRSN